MIEELKKFAPDIKGDYTELATAITDTLTKFDINTPRRIRYFLTQAYVETAGFTKFVEDLYYSSASRIVEVWPSRFTLDKTSTSKALAYDYVKDSKKLGCFVYANRNGNGNIASEEGWIYRGMGGFGLTGKSNYAKCSEAVYGDNRLVTSPELVQAYEAGLLSAGWFWSSRELNELADKDEFSKVTEIINGSTATVPARLKVLNIANTIF